MPGFYANSEGSFCRSSLAQSAALAQTTSVTFTVRAITAAALSAVSIVRQSRLVFRPRTSEGSRQEHQSGRRGF